MSKFLQIHTLTNYHASLLNRDDAGYAKRIPFGSASRTRISSQCLKRHWRTHDGEYSLNNLQVPSSLRSRETFEQLIVQSLCEDGRPEVLVRAATEGLMEHVLGKSAKAKAKTEEEATLHTSQITVLGEPEVRYLRGLVEQFVIQAAEREEYASLFQAEGEPNDKELKAFTKAMTDWLKKDNKELKKNLAALKLSMGLSAALFGRMVTSDYLSRGDAAIHVAHAFTVHAEASEPDYFSAVDELNEELGSGHINSSELTTGLFYGYVVVDVPLLVSNLEGVAREDWESADKTLARGVIEHLIQLIARVSPGAKLGPTAPYNYASAMLVEAGDAQPRAMSDAFLKPVSTKGDVLEEASAAWKVHIDEFREMYGWDTTCKFSGRGATDVVAQSLGTERVSVNELAQFAVDATLGEA